jgi:hypothetical protein
MASLFHFTKGVITTAMSNTQQNFTVPRKGTTESGASDDVKRWVR